MTDDIFRHDYTGSAIRSYSERHRVGERDRARVERYKAMAPENDGTMSEVTMLSHYMGPNADTFLKHHRGLGKPPMFSFNFAAFLFPFAWMFYRKMFGYGALVLLLPVVLFTVFPDLDRFSSISLSAILASQANAFYLWVATGRVKKLKAQADAEAMTQEELTDLLKSSGSVSKIGAAFGLVISLSLEALPFIVNASASIAG